MPNTALTLTVNVATKRVTASADIALAETVDVTIVNLGNCSATNLTLEIRNRAGDLLVTESDFTLSGSDAIGTVDLDTAELTAEFANTGPRETRQFALGVWDAGNKNLLVNDTILIMHNRSA